MYSSNNPDKRQFNNRPQGSNNNNYSYRGNNRRSWPGMNPRQHHRHHSLAPVDVDGDVQMGGGSSRDNKSWRGKPRFNPGYKSQFKYNRGRGAGSGWWKIVVHDADKFDKDDFLRMLDNTTNETIDPQKVHVERGKLVFWVKNPRAKDAIRKQSHKLTLKDHTIQLFAVQDEGPQTQVTKEEQKKFICDALVKRYSDGCLDLTEFHRDPDLQGKNAKVHLLAPVLGELIAEKCAEMLLEINFTGNNLYHSTVLKPILAACKSLVRVKLDKNSVQKLSDLRTLKDTCPNLTHLSLIDNPVAGIMDNAEYISEIRKMFPCLIHLDNVALPEKVQFDLEVTEVIPPTKKCSYMFDPASQALLEGFLKQYVQIHDSPDPAQRANLSPAYDENALFSLTGAWRPGGVAKPKFPARIPSDASKRNRNFCLYSRAEVKESRLFVGRENVIKEICGLAQSRHLFNTINIDASPILNTCFTAILSGIMDCEESFRTFSRSFILKANPANNSFLILNDQLSIVRAPPDVVEHFQKPPTLPSDLSDTERNTLIQRIQTVTKMTVEYCRMCLEAANWDYDRAMAKFSDMHSKKQIPPEVFMTN